MKFLFDLFPVILFFGSFSWAKNNIGTAQSIADGYLSAFVAGPGIPESSVPILLATAFAIVASALQIVYLFLRRKKIEATLWISLIVITVFGGATIYFGSEEFIKWKPTVLYWLFGGALLIAHAVFRKNLVRAMMEKKIRLPDSIWRKLNVAWIVFFVLMGIVNLYVAFWGGFETSTWVSFKLFGGMGLMLVFVIGQSIYLSRHLKNA
ncbi:septation protein A [Oxalobacter aliiformigenes]|uniref:septation protein A n=1 Tax=Oxalobacter aliiformigenes TaxID=2946593 RepID=UPI0022B002E9|nr:septation protein A [Oxalobacter aliiformigenes]MCZ4065105.1 septation protein A [Oxalobacter aliiformigenes]WAV99364.1 septation protein A [Oxalobacter aliiformigenes]